MICVFNWFIFNFRLAVDKDNEYYHKITFKLKQSIYRCIIYLHITLASCSDYVYVLEFECGAAFYTSLLYVKRSYIIKIGRERDMNIKQMIILFHGLSLQPKTMTYGTRRCCWQWLTFTDSHLPNELFSCCFCLYCVYCVYRAQFLSPMCLHLHFLPFILHCMLLSL